MHRLLLSIQGSATSSPYLIGDPMRQLLLVALLFFGMSSLGQPLTPPSKDQTERVAGLLGPYDIYLHFDTAFREMAVWELAGPAWEKDNATIIALLVSSNRDSVTLT